MLGYDTYTVYLRGFERVGSESGLSLTNAFRRVLSLTGRSYEFEERGEGMALMLSRSSGKEEIVSTAKTESGAKRELMGASMDGRFGFAAVLDSEFLKLYRGSAHEPVELDDCAAQFLLRAVIADYAHRFPTVRMPRDGHAKAGFDMGLTSFAGAVAGRLRQLGIEWTRRERPWQTPRPEER